MVLVKYHEDNLKDYLEKIFIWSIIYAFNTKFENKLKNADLHIKIRWSPISQCHCIEIYTKNKYEQKLIPLFDYYFDKIPTELYQFNKLVHVISTNISKNL